MSKFIKFLLKYKITNILFILYTVLFFKIFGGISFTGISLSLVCYALLSSFIVILIFNIIANLNKSKYILLKIISIFLFIIITILLIFDLFFIFNYNSPLNLGVFASIIETNWEETKSMVSNYWFISIILIISVFILNIYSLKELKKTKLKAKTSLIILILLIIIMPFSYYYKITNRLDKTFIGYKEMQLYLKNQPLLVISYFVYQTCPFIINDIIIASSYINETKKIYDFKYDNKKLPLGILNATKINVNNPDKIYIIIGESSYRNHYSLYGYNFNTTPFLDSLSISQNSTLTYYNAISPASITRDAIRLTLTFSTPHNPQPFYENKSIINLAKDMGYETTWLSNQPKLGLAENYISLLASTNDYLKYNNIQNWGFDDLILVDQLPLFYKKNKKQCIFIHLRGNHISYKDGYDDKDILNVENEESKDYDRTIHHTDRFFRKLNQFIEKNNDNAILYYFSDHGEIINIGHGYEKGIQQFQIPLLSINYNSNIKVDSIIKTYKNRETSLLNSSSTPYILSEIMGYKVDKEVKEEIVKNNSYIFNCISKVLLFNEIKPWENSIP